MTLISAMISFVVLLLATYSYSAPILSETQNATGAIELQNSTTKTSIEKITDALENKPKKRGFFSLDSSSTEEWVNGIGIVKRPKVRVFTKVVPTVVQHNGFVQTVPVVQQHTRFVQTPVIGQIGTIIRPVRDSTVSLEDQTTVIDETTTLDKLNIETETNESNKRKVEVETDESNKRETENEMKRELEAETKESDKRESDESKENKVEAEAKESVKHETETDESKKLESETNESKKREVEAETDESMKREVESETEESMKREFEAETDESMKREFEAETNESNKREVESETDESMKREVESETDESMKREVESETEETKKRGFGFDSFESFESSFDFNKRAIGPIAEPVVDSDKSKKEIKVEKEINNTQLLSSANGFAKTTGLVGEKETSSTKVLAVIPGRIAETKVVMNQSKDVPVTQKPLSQGKN